MENHSSENSKEWKLIEQQLSSVLGEQKRARRWGIFFKFLTFGYLAIFLISMVKPGLISEGRAAASKGEAHTALVDVTGQIMADSPANADDISLGLRDAFEEPMAKAVLIRINSPGGSPVQSGFVYDEIMRLRKEYPQKMVYAAITDIGASGAYYIASAAHQIYADKASLVGSIGVISAGFGFSEFIDRWGVDRRIITAGANKAFLDPFKPRNEAHEAFFSTVIGTVHEQFINSVREGRGDRLKEDEGTFSGLIWTGEQAVEKGLIDGLGSPGYVAREIVGHEEIVNYTAAKNPFEALVRKFGVSVGSSIAQHVGMQLSLQ